MSNLHLLLFEENTKMKIQFLLFALFTSLNIYATTYFVDKSGNDSNPGTEAQPWLTIQKPAKRELTARNP